jgi:hypothetical protein
MLATRAMILATVCVLSACRAGDGPDLRTGQPTFGFTVQCPPDCSGTLVTIFGYGVDAQGNGLDGYVAGTISVWQTNPGSSERFLGTIDADLIDAGEARVPDGGQLRLQASPDAACVFFRWGNPGTFSTSNPVTITYPPGAGDRISGEFHCT